MKKIYLVLTHTGTMLSRLIKTFTKDEFTHSSIALEYRPKTTLQFWQTKSLQSIRRRICTRSH